MEPFKKYIYTMNFLMVQLLPGKPPSNTLRFVLALLGIFWLFRINMMDAFFILEWDRNQTMYIASLKCLRENCTSRHDMFLQTWIICKSIDIS
jgi:hypothetical protein